MSKKKKRRIRAAGRFFFLLYLLCLTYFLFFSERYGRTEPFDTYRYNLVPFQEIKRYVQYRDLFSFELFWVNIVGNVAAFVPFGFFVPLAIERCDRFVQVFSASLFFSLAVETAQLLFKCGIFDVDDLILNTLGGVIGYIAFLLTRRHYRNRG